MNQVAVSENFDVEVLVDFSQKNPWKPQYPSHLVRRFLNELVSKRDLIFDFHDDNGRVASAVLLDKVNNPANDACLEILGLRADIDPRAIVREFLELAKEKVSVNRSGFQFALPQNSELNGSFLQELGLQEYYDTYEMKADLTGIGGYSSEITSATMDDCHQVYKVLCEAFAKNPDTSITDIEAWEKNFLKSPDSFFFLWKDKGDLLGFANLVVDDNKSGEVRTIGVLPQARGLGLGYKLLNHCLQKCQELDLSECHLTVAVTNHKALGIYLRSGFKAVEKFKCYRMSFNKGL